MPVGNSAFDVKKFYIDLLPEDDEDGLADLAAQKFDDLMSLVKKRVHKKRALGRIRFDLGGGVQLGVSTYSFVQRAYKPSKVRLTRYDVCTCRSTLYIIIQPKILFVSGEDLV